MAAPDSSRKLLSAFVFVLIFAAAAYEFSELVLAGDMMGFAYVALLAIGSVFIIAILNNWRIFCYIPLYFVGYALFNSEADLRRFFRVNAWIALIITGLGLDPSFLNPARPAEESAN